MSEPQIASRLSANDLVQTYLDSLLRDVSAELAEPVSVPLLPELDLAATPVVMPDIDLAGYELPRSEEPQISEAPQASQTPKASQATERDPRSTRLVPEWGQQGFAALVFDVAGLKMAAPLHLLGGITLLEDSLQPVVAQADWFMGLLRWNGKNLRVVDTARFVMPERLHDNSHRANYQSVVVLGDSLWALAVDNADESVHLQSSEIRWKTVTGNRPWLAGTLLERLCALMDVDTLVELLDACERTADATASAEVA